MSRYPLIAASIALAGTVLITPGRAQEPVPPQGPEPVDLRLDRGPERIMQFVMNRRARLGLKVNLRARDTDSVGAYVDAVTPNGPAAKAGVQTGDIITKVDGKSVLAGARDESLGERESLPGLRLIELAAKLAPNDTVPIELRRGKDRRTVSVVTADEPDIFLRARPGGRDFAFRFRPDGPRRMGPWVPLEDDLEFEGPPFLYGSPLGDLELAPLNPDLGRYLAPTRGCWW